MARGVDEAGLGETTEGRGVLLGSGVSSPLRADFFFGDCFLAPDFFLAGFGVGVAVGDFLGLGDGASSESSSAEARFFGFGLGDFAGVGSAEDFFRCFGADLLPCFGDSAGDGDASPRAFKNSSRLRFSSSATWPGNRPERSVVRARTTAIQNLMRTTAAHRNRATSAFNLERRPS
jgi:hypothetical protein